MDLVNTTPFAAEFSNTVVGEDRMLGSVVLRAAAPGPDAPPAHWRAMAHTLADTARARYRALVYEDPRFTAYFRAGTPIDVVERMQARLVGLAETGDRDDRGHGLAVRDGFVEP